MNASDLRTKVVDAKAKVHYITKLWTDTIQTS